MGINYSKFHEQTVDSYRYVDYGGNSIYNSGCGPASLANALMVLGIADITVKAACEFAVFCGARIRNAGTSMRRCRTICCWSRILKKPLPGGV